MIKAQKVDKDLMKRNNTKYIFSEIYKKGQISRSKIAEITKMSIMSTGRIADFLIEMGLVDELEMATESTPGRPPKLLRVSSQNLLCLGISIEKNGLRMGIADPYGKIVRRDFFALDVSEGDPADKLKIIGGFVRGYLDKNADLGILPFIGVSIPGLVDVEHGKVSFSSQLKWNDVDVAGILKKIIGVKNVVIENDIKSVALAESRFGVSLGYQNCAQINIGDGVGGAVIIGGEIYRGRNNMAGEIGHIIINTNGKMCECGRRGCLQTNIAESAILQEARAVKPGIELPEIFTAYQNSELWARNLLNHVADYLSITINLLVNAYSPDVVVLCGSLIEGYPFFRKMFMKSYKNQLSGYIDDSFPVKISDFGIDGPVIGGANIAFMHMLDKIIR